MNYNSYFNPFDFGLDLGAGADFPIGPVIPFVELSYYLGLVNVALSESNANTLEWDRASFAKPVSCAMAPVPSNATHNGSATVNLQYRIFPFPFVLA